LQTSGNISVSVATVNGSTDQRATNNTKTASFSFPAITPPTDYPFTNYNFVLVKDNYGVETTWQLKNSAGTIVQSGGPYTGSGSGTGTTVANLNWTLPPNCYTLTIFDTAGDGICCNYGTGSWTLRTNSGATVVGTGGTFTTSESVSFKNESLSNTDFELMDAISLYPNPTKDILNVSVPSLLGTPKNINVYNSLGQSVKSIKAASSEFNFETSSLSNGVYFIQLDFENTTKTLRFIKN
jgi:hypothetical protein